jgi:hypothetical protein
MSRHILLGRWRSAVKNTVAQLGTCVAFLRERRKDFA